MKSYRLLVALAVAGFFGVGVTQAETYRVNFKLTLQAQDLYRESVGNSQVYKSTIAKIKVTNKDMLKLLGVSFSTDFTGGTLALQSGRFQVRDSTGTTVVRDATSSGVMLNFEAGESDYVLQETGNEAKDTYNGLGLCTTKAGYADLKGNQFVLSGVKQQTAKESNGKWTYSFIFNGSGTGYINTPPAGMEPLPLFIITGTLDGKSQ